MYLKENYHYINHFVVIQVPH